MSSFFCALDLLHNLLQDLRTCSRPCSRDSSYDFKREQSFEAERTILIGIMQSKPTTFLLRIIISVAKLMVMSSFPSRGQPRTKKDTSTYIFVGVIIVRRLRQAGLGVRSVRTRPTGTPLLCEVIYDGRRLR